LLRSIFIQFLLSSPIGEKVVAERPDEGLAFEALHETLTIRTSPACSADTLSFKEAEILGGCELNERF
jgi:hypothetical protein